MRRLAPPARGWDFERVLVRAQEAAGGDVVAAFDVPLGVPRSALDSTGTANFLDWLDCGVFEADPVNAASDWSPQRPFARPVGTGSWRAIELVARGNGFDLKRHLDRAVGSESMFKLVGPRQVGQAARSLWAELQAARRRGVVFRVWPFEVETLDDGGVTIAEIYPAAAYAIALSRRPTSKADLGARVACIEDVQRSPWYERDPA